MKYPGIYVHWFTCAFAIASGISCASLNQSREAPGSLRNNDGIKALVRAWEAPNGNWGILFSITNPAEQAMALARANVPWLFPYSVNLTAIVTNANEGKTFAIGMALPVIDPPPGDIVIPRQGTIVGSLPVLRLFPSITDVAMTNEVVVSWRYVMRQPGWSNTYSGSVVLRPPSASLK
jgi:hypothetical protein